MNLKENNKINIRNIKKENEQHTHGITLISLIITIIVLIILAGIAINFAIGENGIITKTQNSKEQYTQEEIKEKLNLKISDIQIEKQGKANLSDLDGINLEGYDVSAGNIGRMITVTKGSETYIFWVDSNLNITEFDGNISIENSDNSNTNTTIQEFTPTISNINGTYFTVEANATSSESTIVAYEFFVNGEYKGITFKNSANTMNITGLELDTEYEVYVLALDDKGTTRKSTIIKQKTLDKLYLYKEGDECTLATGGWNTFVANAGTGKKESTYLYMYNPVQKGYYTTYGFNTNNKIDLSKYSKLKSIVSVKIYSGGEIFNQVGIWNGNYSVYDSKNVDYQYSKVKTFNITDSNKEENELDISEINTFNNISTSSRTGGGYSESTELKVFEIWLEK